MEFSLVTSPSMGVEVDVRRLQCFVPSWGVGGISGAGQGRMESRYLAYYITRPASGA